MICFVFEVYFTVNMNFFKYRIDLLICLINQKYRSLLFVEKNRTEVYLSPLASKKKKSKQTKHKVKDLTSKFGTQMETGRLQRDLLGLRVEQPPGLLFNGLI